MRLILLVSLALVASTYAFTEVRIGYHDAVGIPEAKRIREAEESFFANSTGRFGNNGERIVGGVLAPINAHPYLGGLVISFWSIAGNSACGSSLLTANRLVTAAHCWFDGNRQASQFVVVLGSSTLFFGGTRIATSNVLMHPQWNPFTLANDVAMIFLPTNLFFTQAIQPVALPSGTQLSNSFVGMWGTASGYGKTSDQQLGVTTNTQISQVNIQVISVAACQAVYGSVAQSSNICTSGAGGVGICGGDSGGPLVINLNGQTTLVGVSSFVPLAGCQLGHPSAFARITSFYSFIIQNL